MDESSLKIALGKRKLLPKAGSESSSSSPPMEGGTQAEPTPKRKCVSSACMPCRRRKSKCDSGTPCGACSTVYSTECVYDLDQDNRRKGALKRQIRELDAKEKTLSTLITLIQQSDAQHAEDIFQYIREHKDDDHETIAAQVLALPRSNLPDTINDIQSGIEAELVVNFSSKPFSKGIGENRHYGGTSNLLLDNGPDSITPALLDGNKPWTSVTNDKEFIEELLNLYLSWSHPWYLLFSEEIFLHGYASRKVKYCTPLLVNAILAMGCHWSDRQEARADANDPKTIGDHFFTEAKRLLESDHTSSLTTVQALGLMSLHQAMNGRDSSGRRYVAQMMSMAVELGLHLAIANRKYENATQTEIEARRITWWGCFVLENAWAICIGRLPTIQVAAMRLKRPEPNEPLENKIWRPYGMNPESMERLAQRSYKYTFLLQFSLLSELVNDILHKFYAPKEGIISRRLIQCYKRLQAWNQNLPESLTLRNQNRGPVLAQVIILHMYYYNCVINLFRPFLKLRFLEPDVKQPFEICIEAANMIHSLIELYATTYGLKRLFFVSTHCVVTAGIIHCVVLSTNEKLIGNTNAQAIPHNTSSNNNSNDRPKNDQVRLSEQSLLTVIQALLEMNNGMSISTRFLEVLHNLMNKYLQTIPPPILAALTSLDPPKPPLISAPPIPSVTSTITPQLYHTTLTSTRPQHSNLSINPPPQNHPRHPDPTPSPLMIQPRKDSAPEVISMAPSIHNNAGSLGWQPNPQMFWTPDPNEFEGVPVGMLGGGLGGLSSGGRMNINSLLDGGAGAGGSGAGMGGEGPGNGELFRAGFTMGGWDEDGALLGLFPEGEAWNGGNTPMQ